MMMKSRLNALNVAIFTLVMLMLVSGCGKPPKEQLVGVWQDTDGEREIVQFFEDGSFSVKSEEMEPQTDGEWLILEDGRLATQSGSTLALAINRLEFDGNEMILEDGDGLTSRYRRMIGVPEVKEPQAGENDGNPEKISASKGSTASGEDDANSEETTASKESSASGENDIKPEETTASKEGAASDENDIKPEEIAALKESAASGDRSAQNKLCRFYCEFPNQISNDDFALFNNIAADGQPWAQFMLGVCYSLQGSYPYLAIDWVNKSMEQGFDMAGELLQILPKEQSEMLSPEGQKKLQARGAAMLDTFASEFMPKTHARYKQISEKFALTSKTLTDLEASIRENGGDPANDETYKTIKAKVDTLSQQVYRIRDTLCGNYCYRKMEVFTSEDLLKRDNEFAAWVDAEYLTKKAAAPKGE